MGAIASSIAALSPLGSGAIWKKIVKHTTLLNETCTTSPPSASFQMGKGRLAYFSPKCSAIIPLFKGLWKNISPFSYVAPFGYELTTTRQTRALTFWRNFAYLLSVTQKFNRDASHQLLYCAQWDVGAAVHRSAPLCKKILRSPIRLISKEQQRRQ